MRPFNLEEALAGKPCVNSKGDKVVIFADVSNLLKTGTPIYGVVYPKVGMNYVENYSKTGQCSGFQSPLVGMWKEKQPEVDVGVLPAPLLEVDDGERVWGWMNYDGSFRTIEFTFEHRSESHKAELGGGNVFATEEDAQAWLDAMKGARR